MSELQLSKPITAHGETIHVLELREPSFDEIEQIGFPFTIGSEGNIKIDSSVSLRYIPVLAGIPALLPARWRRLIFSKPQ